MYILLLLFSLGLGKGNNELYNNLSDNNNVCQSVSFGCSFIVTYNYPISLQIPSSFPLIGFLLDYYHIRLKFNIPKEQKQKSFYLDAYYNSDGENIISNGDCYYIDLTNNTYYELRIYKKLRIRDYIRLGFLGIPEDFIMDVRVEFLFIYILLSDVIPLDYTNSLNMSNVPSLKKDLDTFNKKKEEQKIRLSRAKDSCKLILNYLFNKELDLIKSFIGDAFFSNAIVPINPYVITEIYISVGLIMSIQFIFHHERVILSETTIREGKIIEHIDGLEYLEGSNLISNDVLKMVELYNKKITDGIINLNMKKDFTLTISTNKDINYIVYTLKFYFGNTKLIDYEAKIIVFLTNYKLRELIINSHSMPKIFNFIPYIINCFSENGISVKNEIEYIIKGIFIASQIISLTQLNPILGQTVASLLIKKTDWAKVGGTILDMDKDEKGIYHARFDCWQQCFGYSKFYDSIFDLFTDMRYNNNGIFTYNKQNYILWAWKGDYLNLGAGAELGIYYGGKDIYSFWNVDKSLAMPMTLTLKHKNKGIIVDNWKNTTWWLTAFNPNVTDIYATDLIAYFTVKFLNDEMFKEFSKVEREGWSYNNKTKIASLVL